MMKRAITVTIQIQKPVKPEWWEEVAKKVGTKIDETGKLVNATIEPVSSNGKKLDVMFNLNGKEYWIEHSKFTEKLTQDNYKAKIFNKLDKETEHFVNMESTDNTIVLELTEGSEMRLTKL